MHTQAACFLPGGGEGALGAGGSHHQLSVVSAWAGCVVQVQRNPLQDRQQGGQQSAALSVCHGAAAPHPACWSTARLQVHLPQAASGMHASPHGSRSRSPDSRTHNASVQRVLTHTFDVPKPTAPKVRLLLSTCLP
jgi:hypothetical protein